jgi:ADP-L-glycero-D-manno-heptose 6-epimerase
MKQILVTGGGGFIGSVIAGYLADKGKYNVVVSDFFGTTEKWRNLSKHRIYDIIAPQENFAWLDAHKDKLEAVIHMGAVSSTTETNVELLLENNFALSRSLWNWCAEHGKRLIYASSAATYGGGEHGFEDRIDMDYLAKLHPMNAYGWSKQMFDQFVSLTLADGGKTPPQWVGLKFFNVYGPNEYHKGDQKSVACTILPHARHGRPVHLFKSYNPKYKDGEQLRDFVYIKDCVAVVEWLLDHPQVNGLFNLGSGKARTFKDLAHAVFSALGKAPAITYFDMPEHIRPKYQYLTEANMAKLQAAGYTKPFTSLEDGIKDYLQNYLLKDDPFF